MIGTVALLDAPDRAWIDALDTKTFFRPPAPHVSFHVAAAYDWTPIVAALDAIATETAPFEAVVTGAEIFDVEDGAALHLQLARSDELTHLQRCIYDDVNAHAHHAFDHYVPQAWIPHVTIAQRAPALEAGDAAMKISSEVRGRTVRITNLAFLSVDYGRYVLRLVSFNLLIVRQMSNRRELLGAL